jgi:DNA-binding Xre family transcriptional regulator
MPRSPLRARNWLLSFFTSARLMSATARAAAGVVGVTLLAAPALSGCTNEYDLNTDAGLKKSLEDGKNLKAAVDKLKDLSDAQLTALAPALQKRFIEGATGFEVQIFQALTKLRSPDYVDAYVHALKSKTPDLIRAAAAIVGDLNLLAAEEGLAYAFDNTAEPALQQVLLTEGRKVKSPLMAERASNILKRDSIDNVPPSLLHAVCKTLEVSPNPDVIERLLTLAYRKDYSANIIADCVTTIQGYGPVAYPALLSIAQRKHKAIEQMVKRKDLNLSREDVLIFTTGILLGLGHPDTSLAVLAFITDPTTIQKPALLSNADATEKDIEDWNATLVISAQQSVQVLNRIGAQAHGAKVREALLNVFRWGPLFKQKYKLAKTLLEPIMRGEAIRALAENDLLTAEDYAEVLAVLRDKSWESDDGMRAGRTLLAGNLLVYLTIAGIQGIPTQTIYNDLGYILQSDVAFSAYGKLVDVAGCVSPDPAYGQAPKPELECYNMALKDLLDLTASEPIELIPPTDPAALKLWQADTTLNAYKDLRDGAIAIEAKCKADADRLACIKAAAPEYQKIAQAHFPKLPELVYLGAQTAEQLKQAKIALDTATRCEAQPDKYACYKAEIEAHKAEPESGALARAVYAIGKSKKPELFPDLIAIYRAQYDTAQYMGNALYRLAAPENLPLIEEVIKTPNSQVGDGKARQAQNNNITTQMTYLKYHVQNRAKAAAPK